MGGKKNDNHPASKPAHAAASHAPAAAPAAAPAKTAKTSGVTPVANAQTPINFSTDAVKGYCDRKCTIKSNITKDTATSLTWYNYGSSLMSWLINSTTSARIFYNANEYCPVDMVLQLSSEFQFNGSVPNAQVLIGCESVGVMGAPSSQTPQMIFFVIPVLASNVSGGGGWSAAGEAVSAVIQSCASSGNGLFEQFVVDVPLSSFIPSDGVPFFSVTPNPVSNWSGTITYIAVPLTMAAYISQEDLQTLQSLIPRPNGESIIMLNGGELFYNEQGMGAHQTKADQEMVMDCQPIGVSNEETIVTTKLGGSSSSSSGTNSGVQKMIIMIVIMFLVILSLVLIYFALTWVGVLKS